MAQKSTPLWLHTIYIILALIFLFEEWVWNLCVEFGHWLVAKIPFERFKAALQRFIDRLPPALTLIVFIVPVLIVEPFKLLGLYLIGTNHLFAGIMVFVAAKFAAFAVIAFVFELCRTKLLQIGWFCSLYQWVLKISTAAHNFIAPYKAAVHSQIADIKQKLRDFLPAPSKKGFWWRVKCEIRALRERNRKS